MFVGAFCIVFGLALLGAAATRFQGLRRPKPRGDVVAEAILGVMLLIVGLVMATGGAYYTYRVLSGQG